MARRRKSGATTAIWAIVFLVVAAGASWWIFLLEEPLREGRPVLSLAAQTATPMPRSDESPSEPARPPEQSASHEGRVTPPMPETVRPPDAGTRISSLIAEGDDAKAKGDLVTARDRFGEAISLSPPEALSSRLRSELSQIGQETILSPRIFENDPHVERYILQPGDSLAKVAAAHKITADLLAAINQIADKNLVRAGQTIKIIKGPFDAVVDKKAYTLDVYLGSSFVRSLRVGLGADDSTPVGKWRVSSKLSNPTYYPPRGGKIIAADDAQNPLGERWIGLTGIEGAAVGQERYGIHGTIEPGSVGKSSSMGCIRLHNEDIEKLYTYLVEKHSTVTVK